MHIEQPNEPLVVLFYTTNSGRQHTANLTKSQVEEFIIRFENRQNYVVTNLNETYGFNPNLISDFRVTDLYYKNVKLNISNIDNSIKVEEQKEEITTEQLEELKNNLENNELEKAYKDKLDLFKIDCVCGASYVVEIAATTSRGYCNNCKERLFVDRSKGRLESYKGMAWIMTNKYLITAEMINQYT